MKKKYETRYFVTAVVSIPVVRVYGKTEMYRQAAKDDWGVVYRDENNTLFCDEDCTADFYMKDGSYYGLSGNDEVNTKEMPKQAACAAIVTGDSCGYSFWAEDFNQIHFFVTCDANGLIDRYRVKYGDSPIYDEEVEAAFEDLYQQAESDWQEKYRAELPGTVEYRFKQEADKLAQEAGETWIDGEQREQFRQICHKIDQIKSARNFKCTMPLLGYDFDKKIINAAKAASEGRETSLGTPEALGAFLASLPVADELWNVEFRRLFCKTCPHNAERNNPLWWLKQ